MRLRKSTPGGEQSNGAKHLGRVDSHGPTTAGTAASDAAANMAM
jgi:hypothetical protein